MSITETLLPIIIALLGAGTLSGIFYTKTPGFGKYTTSVILLTLVFVVSAVLLASGKIEPPMFANIAFAVAGFAGGLVTAKSEKDT